MFCGNDKFVKPFWHNGPTPGQFYDFPGSNYSGDTGSQLQGITGSQHSSQPITTGTSVVGIKFDSGVMIAADNLISYGSLARFQDVERVFKINNKTIVGAGGEYADFQWLKRHIDQKIIEDYCHNDQLVMKPKSLYTWLTRILYNKRSRFEPLWIDMVVGGMEDGKPFLGHVDLRGRSYEDDVVATGFGKHLALPLVREHLDGKTLLTQEKASELLRKCMEVLYYRDCRAMSKYSVVVCTKDDAVLHQNLSVSQNWQLATMIKGY